jgi:CBS domain-containing protein
MTTQLTARTVASVMTGNPAWVLPHTSYKGVLELLTGRAIGAVPVVSATGRVMGVVSEADLLRSGRRSRLRRHTRDVGRLTAAQLMTSPAITVRSDATVAHAAGLLADSGKRQLFVVDDGRLVGALGRREVLGQFLRADEDILAEIEHDVFSGPAADIAEVSVRVGVEHGVVQLTGWLPWRADIDTALARIAAVPGVIAIRDRLVAAYDDQHHAQVRAR